ncbi:GNAT family N-acetyltransferase [Leucobacter sp. wl10]|uniref:GNAT family N-acetyltransferase n=1 Tax=Leucobacter sp. wl10 TaxID=2304677 RepID=UPI000E5A32C8|nr:GNAT family N-acetyltransferase [Leucobacter sp. wl10]RGE23713.1 GNAT family N-acetyltransferase [Leucobacter sp. wl10]
MIQPDVRTVELDRISRERLRSAGLDYRRVDPSDEAGFDGFIRAVARGFIEDEPAERVVAGSRPGQVGRRMIGVYDETSPQAELPVATVGSWIAPLTVPGGELPMWAVSEVTVAPTHRRRGIARAMLEGELRAAASAGVPMAGLTASEATIYGRYGFGPATWHARWTVDTRRAGWAGAEPSGSLQYLDREATAEALGRLHERTRHARIGEIAGWPVRWRQLSGAKPGEPHGEGVRGVRYLDAAGEMRGAMVFRIAGSEADWARSRLEIRHLIGETAEARAALWRFALQHDLVGTVAAGSRPVDEPLPWLLADARAATRTVEDHGWLRILDLPAVLAVRRLAAPLDIVLRVADPLGFADGAWRVESAADGTCRAVSAGGAPGTPGTTGAEADIEIGVAELSSLYLGGVAARSLAEAGRLRGDACAVAQLDAALRIDEEPFLSIMY